MAPSFLTSTADGNGLESGDLQSRHGRFGEEKNLSSAENRTPIPLSSGL